MNENKDEIRVSPSAAGFGRRLLRIALLFALFAAVGLAVVSSVVFVDETEYVIVERLGEIVAVYDHAEDRGPHWKYPWPIEIVRRFDRRVQLFDPPGREIFTSDKKNITVDAYICWKIAEPHATAETELSERPVVRFFRSLGSKTLAEQRLGTRLRSIVSTQFGQVQLSSLFHVSDSEQGPRGSEDLESPLDSITKAVRRELLKKPGDEQTLRERLGVEIVDVRIKRPNLPLGNQQAVFERMRSERRKIAIRDRSAGMADNRKIKSTADARYAEILAKANRKAEEIRGRAEAESIGVLNAAHSRDPEFYRTLTTLETYRTILGEKTTLVLSASSNLLKMLTEGIPDDEGRKSVPPKGSPTRADDSPTPAENPRSKEKVSSKAGSARDSVVRRGAKP